MSTRDRSARDRAYDQVRADILTLRLLPSQRIDESTVAERVGVSRTPVREAFYQLASEGLVTVVSRGGYVVADMNIPRFRELIEAQHILVRAVTHLLIARVTDADLDRLEQAVRDVDEAELSGDPGAVAETNARLHILEVELSGNSYLLPMGRTIHTHLQRLSFISFGGAGGDIRSPDSPEELAAHYRNVHDEHWGYLAALRDRDLPRALATAVRHVDRFKERVQEYLSSDAADGIDFSGIVGAERAGD